MTMQPGITITELDLKRIEARLLSLTQNELRRVESLEAELERANVVESAAIPRNVVTMN